MSMSTSYNNSGKSQSCRRRLHGLGRGLRVVTQEETHGPSPPGQHSSRSGPGTADDFPGTNNNAALQQLGGMLNMVSVSENDDDERVPTGRLIDIDDETTPESNSYQPPPPDPECRVSSPAKNLGTTATADYDRNSVGRDSDTLSTSRDTPRKSVVKGISWGETVTFEIQEPKPKVCTNKGIIGNSLRGAESLEECNPQLGNILMLEAPILTKSWLPLYFNISKQDWAGVYTILYFYAKDEWLLIESFEILFRHLMKEVFKFPSHCDGHKLKLIAYFRFLQEYVELRMDPLGKYSVRLRSRALHPTKFVPLHVVDLKASRQKELMKKHRWSMIQTEEEMEAELEGCPGSIAELLDGFSLHNSHPPVHITKDFTLTNHIRAQVYYLILLHFPEGIDAAELMEAHRYRWGNIQSGVSGKEWAMKIVHVMQDELIVEQRSPFHWIVRVRLDIPVYIPRSILECRDLWQEYKTAQAPYRHLKLGTRTFRFLNHDNEMEVLTVGDPPSIEIDDDDELSQELRHLSDQTGWTLRPQSDQHQTHLPTSNHDTGRVSHTRQHNHVSNTVVETNYSEASSVLGASSQASGSSRSSVGANRTDNANIQRVTLSDFMNHNLVWEEQGSSLEPVTESETGREISEDQKIKIKGVCESILSAKASQCSVTDLAQKIHDGLTQKFFKGIDPNITRAQFENLLEEWDEIIVERSKGEMFVQLRESRFKQGKAKSKTISSAYGTSTSSSVSFDSKSAEYEHQPNRSDTSEGKYAESTRTVTSNGEDYVKGNGDNTTSSELPYSQAPCSYSGRSYLENERKGHGSSQSQHASESVPRNHFVASGGESPRGGSDTRNSHGVYVLQLQQGMEVLHILAEIAGQLPEGILWEDFPSAYRLHRMKNGVPPGEAKLESRVGVALEGFVLKNTSTFMCETDQEGRLVKVNVRRPQFQEQSGYFSSS